MTRPAFTEEQEDWICHQIGEWYLEWKKVILVHNKDCPEHCPHSQHRLGVAKEILKAMLCNPR